MCRFGATIDQRGGCKSIQLIPKQFHKANQQGWRIISSSLNVPRGNQYDEEKNIETRGNDKGPKDVADFCWLA